VTWSVVYSHNGFFHFGRSDYRCAFDFHFFCAQNGQNGCHRGSSIRSAFPCSSSFQRLCPNSPFLSNHSEPPRQNRARKRVLPTGRYCLKCPERSLKSAARPGQVYIIGAVTGFSGSTFRISAYISYFDRAGKSTNFRNWRSLLHVYISPSR